ncbi:hypothetical protein PSH76_16045 [Pseudomonas sp. FP215]|uniref:hypothetical protein n=1 Tax=Pseudomonas sp. FP215 TaxID=2738126 RepID=UPI0027325DEC|nr:hypothetical protein [Pseudomonas sp. FP215]WLH21587.1 hypothetical protein PSH76_16045 [Pseudomonas sp. FP215]
MQKISDSTTTANAAGEFTEGNPAAGAEATLLKAQWLNAIQRELVGLVLGANIALNRDNDKQVLEAVNLIAKSAVDLSMQDGGLLVTPQVVHGKMADIPVTKFCVAADDTTDKPAGLAYGCGVHIKFPDGKYGFDLLAGITSESYHVRKLDLNGAGVWRELWHNANFDPRTKADKGNTLSAYGITNAYTSSQTDSFLARKVDADRILAAGFIAGITGRPYFRAANPDGSEGAVVELALASHAHSFASLTDKPTTLGGYGIQGVYTAAQVDGLLRAVPGSDSISTVGLQNGNAALPYMRASANNAVIPLALESHTHAFSSITNKPDNFQGYGISGGGLTSPVVISTQAQGPGSAGLSLVNANAGGVCSFSMASTLSGVQILHTNGGSGISVASVVGNVPAPVAASAFLANGSACHTEASFMKPVAGQFVSLGGSAVLPAGGTWAFSVTGYNGGGAAVGGNAGVAAGGTAVGINTNSVGFAWRIQ